MERTIENIDEIKWKLNNDYEFICFTKEIFRENEEHTEVEDRLPEPQTVEECENYIKTYCGNLEIL